MRYRDCHLPRGCQRTLMDNSTLFHFCLFCHLDRTRQGRSWPCFQSQFSVTFREMIPTATTASFLVHLCHEIFTTWSLLNLVYRQWLQTLFIHPFWDIFHFSLALGAVMLAPNLIGRPPLSKVHFYSNLSSILYLIICPILYFILYSSQYHILNYVCSLSK